MKETLGEYLHFTPTEKRGFIFFLGILVLVFSLPFFYSFFQEKPTLDTSEFEAEIEVWEAGLIQEDSTGRKKYFNKNWDYEPSYKKKKKSRKKKNYQEVNINGFPFDPNKASLAELKNLGLPEKVASTLLSFRNKGGKFYKKEDLKKIYGLKKEWYDDLEPFIQIENQAISKTNKAKEPTAGVEKKEEPGQEPTSIPKENNSTKKKEYPKKNDEPVVVDIGSASAEEFQKIRGIGPSFSKRIVKYRTSLGGFTDLSQISEVYGLHDSIYQKIKPSLKLPGTSQIKKIPINSASADDLKAHPYLKWKTANAIVKYREKHGSFKSLDDLGKIYALSPEVLTKLKPYLELE